MEVQRAGGPRSQSSRASAKPEASQLSKKPEKTPVLSDSSGSTGNGPSASVIGFEEPHLEMDTTLGEQDSPDVDGTLLVADYKQWGRKKPLNLKYKVCECCLFICRYCL